MTADYHKMIVQLVNDLPEGEFVIVEQAEKFIAMLREQDSEALACWMDDLVLHAVRDLLRYELGQRRRQSRREMNRAVIEDRLTDGSFHPFAQSHHVGRGVWKRVAEMTGLEHGFVAAQHEGQSTREALLAKFHRQIERRVGTQRTSDVMDEITYARLASSIVGKAA